MKSKIKPIPEPKEENHQYHEYPKIEGRFKGIYEFQTNLITKIQHKMHELYINSNIRNPVLTSQIQKIIIELFIDEYYPLVSRNIKTDNHNIAVIMGGSAYNMNIPTKMINRLYTPTDDIDMKIYTTDINSISTNSSKISHVLSIFKYLIVIICFYVKQIVTAMIEYSRNAFERMEPFVKHTIKKTHNKTIIFNSTKSHISKSKSKSKSRTKKTQLQDGGEYKNTNIIKLKQRRFGILKSYKIKIQIKKGIEKEIIDITDLSYEDTYKLIMLKLNDPDIMITTKISYSIKHINLSVPYYNNISTITFSDTKIIYPSIKNPSFFSYYFMNNTNNKNQINLDITLDKLLKQNINISNIINTKPCKNNCRFISVKCLQVDIIFMLRFAELLTLEDLSKGVIVVPVDSLYKYYKYLIKFIRLHIIKKYFNGTLANNKNFMNASQKLIRYVDNNLKKETSIFGETVPINIIYKNIINNFHQAFFIKKTMFPEYNALSELVDDYNNTVYYINKSCLLFKNLDDKQKQNGETIDSISIQFADNQPHDNINDGVKGSMEGDMSGGSKKTKIILHDNYSFEDPELDNHLIIKDTKTHKYSEKENKIIIEKIHKMLKNEINFLEKLSN
jgi:hypothetical protein